MTLVYKFSDIDPVPPGVDVIRQELRITAGGLPINPRVDVPLDATEADIEVPKGVEISVVRRWYDSSGNYSDSEPVHFEARDTIPPPRPMPLGKPQLICEVSDYESSVD